MSVNLRVKSRRTRQNNTRHSRKKNTIQRISNVYYLKNEQKQGALSSSSSANLSSTCIQTCKKLFKKYDLEHVKSVSDIITNELLKYNTLSLIDFVKMNYKEKYSEIFCAHFNNNACVKSYIDTLMPRVDDLKIYFSNLKYSEADKPDFTVKNVDNLLDKIYNVYASFYNTKGGSPTNTGDDPNEDICPICFDVLTHNNRIIIHPVNCRHGMHSVCAREWWRRQLSNGANPRCPICNMPSDLPNQTQEEIQELELLANEPDEPVQPARLMSRMQLLLRNPRTHNFGRYLLVAGSYIIYRWDVFFNPDFNGHLEYFNGSPLFPLFIIVLIGATYL
jgi:hypothetical protein